jgi:hypothetical protein
MKVLASIEQNAVHVSVSYEDNGASRTDEFAFPFTQNVEGTKTLHITDEALQDLVGYINNVPLV